MTNTADSTPFATSQQCVRGTVHWCNGSEFIRSNRNKLFLCDLDKPSRQTSLHLPVSFRDRFKWTNRLTQRLFRTGIKEMIELGPRRLGINAQGSFFHLDLDDFKLTKVSDFPGPAPLRMGFDGKTLIYGEYFTNRERAPVHVWASTDLGFHWEKVQTLTDIRHVHGIFHDPYEDKFWMTSGDLDHESHLRCSDDLFSSYQTHYSGQQLYRIIELIFCPNHILYGTDTPLALNYIVQMDRRNKQLNQVQHVGSSVFYLRKTEAGYFCTTAIEPSDINASDACEIWQSADGVKWERIACIPKDRWSPHYFQFGSIQIPHGPGNADGIWISPTATLNDGNSCFLQSVSK